MKPITALVTRENGDGIALEVAEDLENGPQHDNAAPADGETASGGSHLKILK